MMKKCIALTLIVVLACCCFGISATAETSSNSSERAVPTFRYITNMSKTMFSYEGGIYERIDFGVNQKEVMIEKMTEYQTYLLNNGWKILYVAINKDNNFYVTGKRLFENPEMKALIEMRYSFDRGLIEINGKIFDRGVYNLY